MIIMIQESPLTCFYFVSSTCFCKHFFYISLLKFSKWDVTPWKPAYSLQRNLIYNTNNHGAAIGNKHCSRFANIVFYFICKYVM